MNSLTELPDEQLTAQVIALADGERRATVALIASLAEFDARIPAHVRRRVWQRDGGQCAFVGTQGGRCTERGFLEFHHVRPYADGGESVVENLELRCRAHNAYEAARWDGTLFAREEREVYSVLDRGQATIKLQTRPHRSLRRHAPN